MMKKINQMLSALLFSAIFIFVAVSCNTMDQEGMDDLDSVQNEEMQARKYFGPGENDPNLAYIGYYSRVRCHQSNDPNDDYEEFFKRLDNCICLTEAWVEINCNQNSNPIYFNKCTSTTRAYPGVERPCAQ